MADASQVPTEPGWYLASVRKRENEDESDLWLNDPTERVWVYWQPDAEFPVQVPGNGFTVDWVIEWGPSLAELLAKAERTDAAEAELLAARSAKPLLDVLRGLSPQDAAALAEMLEDDSMRGAMRGALLRQALGNAEHRYYVVSEGWVDSLRIVELADEIQGADPSDLAGDEPDSGTDRKDHSATGSSAPASAEETSVGRPDRADGKPGTPERCIDCRHFWARRGLCAHKSLCPNNEPGTPCGNPGDGRPAWCPVAPSAPLDEFAENRWRKKPVVITARRMRAPFGVHTLEGHVHGRAGDWCITGVEGESYPCADRIFRATYERADEPAASPVAWVDGRATVGGFVLVHERMTRSHTVACLDDEGIGFVVRLRDEDTAKRVAIAVARAMG